MHALVWRPRMVELGVRRSLQNGGNRMVDEQFGG
jgi:hypothetical protein